MKTRGWLSAVALAAACVIAPNYAMATEIGDIISAPLFTDEMREEIRKSDETGLAVGQSVAAAQTQITGKAAEVVVERVAAGNREANLLSRLNAAANARVPVAPAAARFGIMPLGLLPPAYAGTAIDSATGIYDGSTQVNDRQFTAIHNSMIGYAGTAGVNSGLDTVEYNSGLIHDHQRDIRSDMRTALDECAPGFISRIWASPFHNRINQKDRGLKTGYKYKMTGVAVGYDLISGPINFGATFTYSKGDYEWKDVRDDNTIHNYGGSLYAQYYAQNGFFAAVDGGYNYGKNKWNRYLSGLDGTFAGNELSGWERGRNHTSSYWIGGTLGYDFKTCSGFTLTPTVGLYWNHAESSSYRSTMSGDVAGNYFIGYDKYKKKSLLLPIELTASYDRQISDCSKITLSATGGYSYNFKKSGATGRTDWNGIEGTRYSSAEGITSGRSSWNLGADVNYNYKNFDIGVGYRYEGAKKYQSHSVSALVGVRF